LEDNPQLNINIIFGNIIYRFPNNNKTVFVGFNIEHTLVRRGGRDCDPATPVGKIRELVGKHNYLVRIDKYAAISSNDVIVDYSIPNIENITTSGAFDDYAKKLVYISPLFYPVAARSHSQSHPRDIRCLTTFINTAEPRRRALLDKLAARPDIGHENVNNCFDLVKLQELYKRTRVMINIHQTDHHHTLEELRVLPALCCGIIVVCEESPLSEKIPYHEYVIWAPYREMIPMVEQVLENYDEYHRRIFGGGKLEKLWQKMEEANIGGMKAALIQNQV
jgi:hypothetical protein